MDLIRSVGHGAVHHHSDAGLAGGLRDLDDVIDQSGVRLIGIVPEDAAVSHCAVRGEPLPASSAAAKAFSRIAKRIDGGEAPLLG